MRAKTAWAVRLGSSALLALMRCRASSSLGLFILLSRLGLMQLFSRETESNSISSLPFPVTGLRPVLDDVSDYEVRRQSTRLKNPTASAWCLSSSRRAFDVLFSLLVLAIFAIPMVAIALCVGL